MERLEQSSRLPGEAPHEKHALLVAMEAVPAMTELPRKQQNELKLESLGVPRSPQGAQARTEWMSTGKSGLGHLAGESKC